MSASGEEVVAVSVEADGDSGDGKVHDLLWRRRSSEIIADCRVFQVRRDVSVSPHRGSEHDFFVLES
ncbi:MAG TPA: hypothetical protein VGO96_05380, partial [Pyrinomonadaceae bacterium]|nr:hypothetical protein [Pyrinomonadaceae bacterium]